MNLRFKIKCVKWKNETIPETIPGMEGGGIKENDERGKFNYDILAI
jgi:hypothetical protein